MLLKSRMFERRPNPLKPFLLRIRGGHLLGLAMEPAAGSPCAGCVENWLKDRGVWAERADMSELRLRRDLMADLLLENSAHVFHEIMEDGTSTRLDACVFPHPSCGCNKGNYIAPDEWNKKTNFAFSPITQLRVARYGTPDGNMWLAHAVGNAPLSNEKIVTSAVAEERDASRLRAVELWMAKAGMSDLRWRSQCGEALTSQVVQTGESDILPIDVAARLMSDSLGVGQGRDEAVLRAFHGLAKARTLSRYASAMKNPMLVVGANNWVRGKVPFFLLQQYDLHVLFYPNSMPSWVVGVAAFSRQSSEEKPLFAFASGPAVGAAIEEALGRILETVRPMDYQEPGLPSATRLESDTSSKAMKLNLWWTHWIYRCPKISLRDVLHLEPYTDDLGVWRGYFQDGEPEVRVIGVNNPYLPASLRAIVKVTQRGESSSATRNVRGIGVWAAMRDGAV